LARSADITEGDYLTTNTYCIMQSSTITEMKPEFNYEHILVIIVATTEGVYAKLHKKVSRIVEL